MFKLVTVQKKKVYFGRHQGKILLKTEILNYIDLFIISYQTFEYIDDVMFILKTTTKYFMHVWDMKSYNINTKDEVLYIEK